MTEIQDLINPEPIRPELKNATISFFFDQRQRERVAIKGDGLLVGMRGAFDRDVRAAGKLWAVNVGNHDKILDLRFTIAGVSQKRPTAWRELFGRRSSPFPPPRPRL